MKVMLIGAFRFSIGGGSGEGVEQVEGCLSVFEGVELNGFEGSG